MKIAIVGSRGFPRLELVRQAVYMLNEDDEVWSGAARGVDHTAEATAMQYGLTVVSFRPQSNGDIRLWRWEPGWGSAVNETLENHGTWVRAAFARNVKLAHGCDRMLAFWDGKSKGTAHAISKARAVGKPVEVVYPPRPAAHGAKMAQGTGRNGSLTQPETGASAP